MNLPFIDFSSIEEPENLKRMAHIIKNKIVNISAWDGVSEWHPEEEVVEIPEEIPACIGWSYIDGEFIDDVVYDENGFPIFDI